MTGMPLDIIVGAQWGDEGKGRMVDLLAAGADFVARFNGGDNAGHTVTVKDNTFKLHVVPSGIIHPHTISVIGNGVVLNPRTLLEETTTLLDAGIDVTPQRLRISHAAHLITPAHLALDSAQEAARGRDAIGTTMRGIGPAYTDKVARRGLRVGQMLDISAFEQSIHHHTEEINRLLVEYYRTEPIDPHTITEEFVGYAKQLRPYIGDVSAELNSALAGGKHVLAEGAQGTLLDLDHGTYPFVTSSIPIAAGALSGLGIGIKHVGRIIGITKAFQTRVGAGPFPSEVAGKYAERLRGSGENPWDEYGTTTGRPRRVGWLDLVLLRYAVRINGFTELVITKLDILSGFKSLKLCKEYQAGGQIYEELPMGPANLDPFYPEYEELAGWQTDIQGTRSWLGLPAAAREYVSYISSVTKIPVSYISVGPERDQVVVIR
jgi:adenylosuccinate synthase